MNQQHDSYTPIPTDVHKPKKPRAKKNITKKEAAGSYYRKDGKFVLTFE
jgi:hypothetical protein